MADQFFYYQCVLIFNDVYNCQEEKLLSKDQSDFRFPDL